MADDVKSDARSDRMTVRTLRKNNEEVLRKRFEREAVEKCREAFQAFGECAQRNSLWVVLVCREQNRQMSACMNEHYTEEKFRSYLAERGLEPAPKYGILDRIRGRSSET